MPQKILKSLEHVNLLPFMAKETADLIEDCPAGRSAVGPYKRASRRSELERGEMTAEVEAEW